MDPEKNEESVPLKPRPDGGDNDISDDKQPLQGDKEAQANGKNGNGGKDDNPLAILLANPLLRTICIVITAVVLICILITIIALAFSNSDDDWMEDTVPRMLHLVPKPNGPRNKIQFKRSNEATYEGFKREMDDFLNRYNVTENITDCSKSSSNYRRTRPCLYDIGSIRSHCKPTDSYGYKTGRPCIFVAYKPVLNWTAESWGAGELHQLPLDQKIAEEIERNLTYVFVSCEGRTNFDQQNLGKIEIYPESSRFTEQFFPYTGNEHYQAPFIALKLPDINTNMVLNVECRFWAKNLEQDRDRGSTSRPSAILPFNILVE